ncbi:MAG: ROK family protein [Anaerolineae bacterium]|jgi:glucokinase|nr:ROK family protein [Anaerolineae bacterium]
MNDIIISIDLGGTRIRAARFNTHLHILERTETLTLAHEGQAAVLERIKGLVREVMPADGSKVLGIGISAPGPLNPQTGVIVAPPNLNGWHNVPLGGILREAFDLPVYVGNDANVAALAEYLRGAAKGNYRHIVYVTHSTGIGSGIITEGKLLLGRDGLAAEVGHIPLVFDQGRISTLENEAAGPDMAAQAVKRIQAGETSAIVDLVDGDLSRVTGSIVGHAAQQGDPLALEIVRRSGMLLGLGIVTLLHLFNPEIVIVGGGVSTLGDLIFTPMKEAIERYAHDPAYYQDLVITHPTLGEDVSLVGAAALVLTQGGGMDITAAAQKLAL